MALRQIGGMGGNLIGDHALLDVLAVGQAQMLLGRHIAKHGGAKPANHGRANRAGNMVIARRNIGCQRAQCIEGGFAADLELLVHIGLDLVHGHMAWAFNHHLDIMLPGNLGQFA